MMGNAYNMWVVPLLAMLVAQVLKPILLMVRLRRWDWKMMKQSGGMPSSHTALVVALVTELWLREGGSNPVLAIAMFVALIVMYDAAGVRWQTGRHAAVLNQLLRDLQGRKDLFQSSEEYAPQSDSSAPITRLNIVKTPWWLIDWPILNEHVGHKPTEVLGGCVVGVLVALWVHF
ncbi:MAG: divergent PAP2 family protein [Alicyclobacillus herbarius]|uniref:divergent PAP2 family protein n=1 Tax=Alicyclobacillus herbarius TaxID=122960 RepID=UPI00047971B9|nr:divergent PAP2 family protein [Alicyclobacillus herbarius]MCL6633124.1 divergent PAP2 family protein [Alicyclobacillus herbarius]